MAVGTAAFEGLASLLGLAGGERVRARDTRLGEVRVTEDLLIGKPAVELYRDWRDLEGLPRVLTMVQQVHVLDERRSKWTIRTPGAQNGSTVWEVLLTEDQPGERLAWRAAEQAEGEHTGRVTFVEGPRGTHVHLDLRLLAPRGRSSVEIAKLLGPSPETQIRRDLANWKRVHEVGEAPTVEGQSRGTCGAKPAARP